MGGAKRLRLLLPDQRQDCWRDARRVARRPKVTPRPGLVRCEARAAARRREDGQDARAARQLVAPDQLVRQGDSCLYHDGAWRILRRPRCPRMPIKHWSLSDGQRCTLAWGASEQSPKTVRAMMEAFDWSGVILALAGGTRGAAATPTSAGLAHQKGERLD